MLHWPKHWIMKHATLVQKLDHGVCYNDLKLDPEVCYPIQNIESRSIQHWYITHIQIYWILKTTTLVQILFPTTVQHWYKLYIIQIFHVIVVNIQQYFPEVP